MKRRAPRRTSTPCSPPRGLLPRVVAAACLGCSGSDSAAAKSRSASRSAADARREVRLRVHASLRHELRQGRSGLARDRPGGHRLRSAADAAAGRAAGRNEPPRRDESQRSARVAATRRWCWCGPSCGPAFRKAIASTSKSACRAAAKPPASATAGCSRRGSPKWPCSASKSAKATCWAWPKGRCWSIRRPIRRRIRPWRRAAASWAAAWRSSRGRSAW